LTLTQSTTTPPALSRRLGQRLEALGLGAVTLDADGAVTEQTANGWLMQMIVASPLFQRSVAQHHLTLSTRPGEPAEIWPGVVLIGLPGPKRRPTSNDPAPQPCHAAVALTTRLNEAEQLRTVCDQQQYDYLHVQSQLARLSLSEPGDIQRLAPILCWMQQDAGEIERRHGELQNLSSELSESYEELSLLYKLSTNMTVDQQPEQFLQQACVELQEVTGLRWLTLQLTEDEPRLEDLAGKVVTAGDTECDQTTLHELGRNVFKQFGTLMDPTVIDDVRSLEMPSLPAGADNLLVVPLRTPSRSLGVLFGGDKLDGTSLTSVDSKLCKSLANTLAIFVENRMLYEDMQAMFLGTLHALTSAIDAKDSYTHGHTERVANLTHMLAEQAGFDSETVERVYISGLLHDVGKIGVPESVLCKPGKLTDDEFDLIKMHPQIGARILQDIRHMEDLLPGVLYHHERWDGRGYPHGLAGEDIPLYGRLIGLADAFDAMTSTRTYRQAMSLEDVLVEIRRCAGTQFDPDLAEIFLSLDFTPFFDLLKKHQEEKEELPHG
jgi:HD-GYP domain-containing protein (c-di-GMP phosphodiesterase class II)